MSKFITTLKDSFKLLVKEPKLFLPKIAISLLNIPFYLFFAYYLIELEQVFLSPSISYSEFLYTIVIPIATVILYALLVDLIDYILVNPMYVFLVKDFFDRKPISFVKALKGAVSKAVLIILSLIIITAISLIIWLPFLILYAVSLLIGNFLLTVISIILILIASFLIIVIFYLTYPVISLEKLGLFKSLRSIVKLSLKNKGDVSKATGIMFIFMFLSYIFGFIVEFLSSAELLIPQIIVLIVFVIFRLIMAIFMTYQYVLNPVFYLEYEKGETLRG